MELIERGIGVLNFHRGIAIGGLHGDIGRAAEIQIVDAKPSGDLRPKLVEAALHAHIERPARVGGELLDRLQQFYFDDFASAAPQGYPATTKLGQSLAVAGLAWSAYRR